MTAFVEHNHTDRPSGTGPAAGPPPAAGRPDPTGTRGGFTGTRLGAPAVVAVALVASLLGGGIVALAQHAGPATPAAGLTTAGSGAGAGLDVAAILAKAQPAVVTVRTQLVGTDATLQPVAEQGTGTGVVVAADGVIVTNNHVVSGAKTITVLLADGRALPGRVLGTAPGSDLAVVKVDATGLPTVGLGDSGAVQVGDPVVAIGNALALPGGPTVTQGIVSARERTISTDRGATLEHLLQTDAAINPGNSGGPLLNAAGQVIGINTATASSGQNIGFAIAITPAEPLITQLEHGQSVAQPYLGVQTATVTDQVRVRYGLTVSSGALVVAVSPGSPAAIAGLQPGDVVTAVSGTAVAGADELGRAVNQHRPGERLTLTVTTGAANRQVHLALAPRPAES